MKKFAMFFFAVAFMLLLTAAVAAGGIWAYLENNPNFAKAQSVEEVIEPVCQFEGVTVSVYTYEPVTTYSFPTHFTQEVNFVSGYLNVGYCADNEASSVRYQWYVEQLSGRSGFVRQDDLLSSMQPPVQEATEEANNTGNNEGGNIENSVGSGAQATAQPGAIVTLPRCEFRTGFTAAEDLLGLPSNSLRATGTQIVGPALWVNTTSSDIVSVSAGSQVIHLGYGLTPTTGVFYLYDGNAATPELEDCDVEFELGFVTALNP